MKVIYFGNNVRGSTCLRYLLANNVKVVAGIGHPLSNALWGETVEEICLQEKIPFFQPEQVNSEYFIRVLKRFNFDIAVMSGYGKIIRSQLLELPPMGFINLHGGSLPFYRGSSTSRWVLINDEKIAGISILHVDSGIDTGPILAQKEFLIENHFDIRDIILKQLELFPPLLLDVLIKAKKQENYPVIQNINDGIYWHSLNSDDGKIHWHRMSARQIFNIIRAFTYPYSGAFSFNNGKKIYILKSKEINESFKGFPGRICAIRDNGVVVIARDKGILIERVKNENNQIVDARNILKIGTYFE